MKVNTTNKSRKNGHMGIVTGLAYSRRVRVLALLVGFALLTLGGESYGQDTKTSTVEKVAKSTEKTPDAGTCEKCRHETKIRKKIQPDRLQHFLNPIPFAVSSTALGIDLDNLWSSLRAGLTVGEIATKNGSSPQSIIGALSSSNRAQVDFMICGADYSADETLALYEKADKISSAFVLNSFDLKNADFHIFLAATDWGDPESAVACMQGKVGGRLLDLKYRLDVYDDIRGGQHNFNPSGMNECEIQQVKSFGAQNKQALLDVAEDVLACGAPNYAQWLTSIANGAFGSERR